MSAIGREAAACPGFRPVPGMLWRHPDSDLGDRWPDDPNYDSPWANWGWYPDLDDAATQGAFLFELLPKAWGVDLVGVRQEEWGVEVTIHHRVGATTVFPGEHLPAALVAALKAAPEHQP